MSAQLNLKESVKTMIKILRSSVTISKFERKEYEALFECSLCSNLQANAITTHDMSKTPNTGNYKMPNT